MEGKIIKLFYDSKSNRYLSSNKGFSKHILELESKIRISEIELMKIQTYNESYALAEQEIKKAIENKVITEIMADNIRAFAVGDPENCISVLRSLEPGL